MRRRWKYFSRNMRKSVPMRKRGHAQSPASWLLQKRRELARVSPAAVEPARGGVEQEAQYTDQQHHGHQLGVGQAVAGVEDVIAQARADAEHLAGHQHDP